MENLISNINVFVRLFSSINNLFCNIRWLERNIRNSSFSVLLIVGGILIFAFYMLDESQNGFFDNIGFPPGTDQLIRNYGPFLIVLGIIGLFFYKRFHSGPQSGNIDSVLFGNDDNNNTNNVNNNNDNNNTKVYYGTPISSSQMNRKVMV